MKKRTLEKMRRYPDDAVLRKYSDDEARDDHGRWTSGGGGDGGAATSGVGGPHMVFDTRTGDMRPANVKGAALLREEPDGTTTQWDHKGPAGTGALASGRTEFTSAGLAAQGWNKQTGL